MDRELTAGQAHPGSWEALGAGMSVAEALGCDTSALIFGENPQEIVNEAGRRGADAVLVCDAARLANYRLEVYAEQLSNLVTEREPKALVAVATNRARELLATSALDTGSGLISDVIGLQGRRR